MTTTPPDPDMPDSAEISAAAAAAAADAIAAAAVAAGATAGAAAAGGAASPGGPEAASPPEAPEGSGDPVRLLVQAVGELPAEQRDLVLTWLLRQRPSLARQWTLGAGAHAAELEALRQAAAGQPMQRIGPSAQQVVPVRFPAQQHAQLREWCAEHGFSMATVIRGLVARFLEGQLPDRS
jgi:hypothetical protein